jgi:WD40 repeat protein
MTDFFSLQWQGQLQEAITAIATGADNWAASSAAGEVVCWQDGQLIYYQTAQDSSIDCLQYSSDGQYLAAAGQAGQVKIWREGTIWQQISAPRLWIDRLAWHPLQPILAIAMGKQVQIWQIAEQKLLVTLPFDRSVVCDLCWQPDGSQIAVAGYGGVAVWNWGDWQQYELLAVDTSAHQVAWSNDGQFLAAATLDRQLVIAARSELELPWAIPELPAKIHQLQWICCSSTLSMISNQELVFWQYVDKNWYPHTTTLNAPPTASISPHPHLPLLAVLVKIDQKNYAQENMIFIQDTDLVTLDSIPIASDAGRQSILQWSKSGTHLILGLKSGQISCWSAKL